MRRVRTRSRTAVSLFAVTALLTLAACGSDDSGSDDSADDGTKAITKLGENEYNSNGFFYDDIAMSKERPGTEAELTRKFVEGKGYTLDPEQLLYRFYRSLPDDHRNEFLIFYIEPMADLGIALKNVSENQDGDREKVVLAAARERALKAFTVLEH